MIASVDSLSEEIERMLQDFNVQAIEAVNNSIEETAEEAAEMLRKGGPYRERTGEYTRDWTAGQREKRKSVVEINGYTVYNKKNYQLTHLLEYGHQSRNGGRAKAFSHITPVNEQVGQMVANKLERKLRG